jgi:hypothetical protein
MSIRVILSDAPGAGWALNVKLVDGDPKEVALFHQATSKKTMVLLVKLGWHKGSDGIFEQHETTSMKCHHLFLYSKLRNSRDLNLWPIFEEISGTNKEKLFTFDRVDALHVPKRGLVTLT